MDNGEWTVWRPSFDGDAPVGVSVKTHEIQSTSAKHAEIWANHRTIEPGWLIGWKYRYRPRQSAAPTTLSGSDGGSYYDITINGVKISCNDVIDALDMNFNTGEAFKALWRCGRKPGTPRSYDLDKVVYFASRESNREEK